MLRSLGFLAGAGADLKVSSQAEADILGPLRLRIWQEKNETI